MSENIRIAEGGMSRRFGPVAKLKTAKQGGGSCLWVQKRDVTLGTKYINENGIYRPIDDGKYGFSQFTAAVTDSRTVIGKKQDGKTYQVSKDGAGNLVVTELADHITIETLPSRLQYVSGDVIDYSGIAVKAYGSDDEPYNDNGIVDGEVPFEQLIFPVRYATYQPSDPEVETELDVNPFPDPFQYTKGGECKEGYLYYPQTAYIYSFSSDIYWTTGAEYNGNSYAFFLIFASKNPLATYTITKLGTTTTYKIEDTQNWVAIGDPTKRAYYGYSYGGTDSLDPILNSVTYNAQQFESHRDNIAWSMVFENSDAYKQSVPVQWNRPGDGQTLEAEFLINVEAVTGGGGQAGENGTGRND